MVGAYLDDGGLGSAYLFDATTGNQLRKLIPDDNLGRIQFGISVAIDGGLVLVGARGIRPDGVFTGVAYLFDAMTGHQLAQFVASDGARFDNFGYSVALAGRRALISAHENNSHGTQSGSAYIFDVTTGNQLAKITAADGAAGDLFGWSVAIDAMPVSGARALVGARYGDHRVVGSGSAYLFDVAIVPEPSTRALLIGPSATGTYFRRRRSFIRRPF